jgi:DNA-binding HxlR family transcriptional regulator
MPQNTHPCPVEAAIHVIGGKWKLLVLRSLLLNGPQRYSELLTTVSSISPKELTRNVRELSETGLISRDAGATRVARY